MPDREDTFRVIALGATQGSRAGFELPIAFEKLFYNRVLKAKKRGLLVFLRSLSIGGDPKYRSIAVPDLKVRIRNSDALRALLRHGCLKIPHQARHTLSTIVHLLVLVEAKTFQILKKLPHDLPRRAGVINCDLKFLPRSHQPGIPNRILIESVIGQPLGKLTEDLPAQVFRNLTEFIHFAERLGDFQELLFEK